jgi:hypothetical protein
MLAPLIPYVLGILAVIGIYLGVKQKGVQQERQRQVKVQQKADAAVKQKIDVAQAKDVDIDTKAQEAKDEVVKDTPVVDVLKPGDPFKF